MRFKVDFWEKNKLLVHVGFWLAYLVFNNIAWIPYDSTYLKISFWGLLFLPVKLTIVYLNFYWLMPAYLLHKKYFRYGLFIIPLIAFGGAIQWLLLFFFSTISADSASLTPYVTLKFSAPIISLVAFTVMLELLKQWYQYRKQSEELVREKLIAELNFLKMQVHPHFLFNTLNNLYSLTLQKSDYAPKIVLKLSELMRYILYEASNHVVFLQKEIDHLKNYAELERLRYGSRLDLSLNFSGDISGKMIAPMILLPFVENSFKHGVSNETDNVWVTLDLKVKDELLLFKIENSKASHELKDYTGYTKGIGLKNIKRRLELMYPGAYKLDMNDNESTYSVDLKLHLNKSSLYD